MVFRTDTYLPNIDKPESKSKAKILLKWKGENLMPTTRIYVGTSESLLICFRHVLDLTTCKATEEELFKFEMHLASYLVF